MANDVYHDTAEAYPIELDHTFMATGCITLE